MKDQGIANTPRPPYYAVIFTSLRTSVDDGYGETADRMLQLAPQQPGYLGVESVREGSLGITVSYWRDLESIKSWKAVAEHRLAQQRGRERWYRAYQTRICRVERDYDFTRGPERELSEGATGG
jgi:heme-degrading monooxygenase HmoA